MCVGVYVKTCVRTCLSKDLRECVLAYMCDECICAYVITCAFVVPAGVCTWACVIDRCVPEFVSKHISVESSMRVTDTCMPIYSYLNLNNC